MLGQSISFFYISRLITLVTFESILNLALDMWLIPRDKNDLKTLLTAKCSETVQITDAAGKTHLTATFVIDLNSSWELTVLQP